MTILKKLLLSSAFFVISATTFAANMPADSVGVENNNGKKVILHKLDPKDNYYSIGRRYGVSPKVIQQFNNNASLQIGHIIKVPTERSIVETTAPAPKQEQPAPVQTKPAATPAQVQTKPAVTSPVQQQPVKKEEVKSTPSPVQQQQAPVQQAPVQQQTAQQSPVTQQQYKVSAHETLYSIAKRFNTTVEAITSLNKLTNTNLSAGQILLIPNGTQPAQVQQDATATPAAHPIDTTKGDTSIAADSLNRHIASKYGLFEKNEKGVATWIDDASLDPNKKLILHRTAPIGTVMRITNPMNGRTTFAKVVGRFTDTESTRDAIVVMTKNVASALGALDKRFQVNISYGTPNE